MKEYTTTGIIDIYSGQIGLDEKQAEARKSNLKKIDKNIYEIISPVHFKAGEIIKFKNPDKILAARLEEKVKIPPNQDKMEDYIIAAEQAIKSGRITADGAPEVRAMEEILNCNVTAEERDAAWDAIKILIP